jgi:hypothetical protein
MKRVIIAAAAVSLLSSSFASALVSLSERQTLSAKQNLQKKAARGRVVLDTTAGGEIRVVTAAATFALIDSSGVEYFIVTDTTDTSSSASGAASDATYTTDVNLTTTGGGTSLTTPTDSFDGYGALFVNGVPFTNNGNVGAECGGRELVFNPQAIGNLLVRRKVFVPGNDEFIQWVDIITNIGATDENVQVAHSQNNLGSDGNTTVDDSSNGGANTATTWIVTDGDIPPNDTDAVLCHVLQGDGPPVGLSSINFANADDTPNWGYDAFTLEPGETGIFLTMASPQPTFGEASAQCDYLAALPNNATQCLSDEELSQVLNFDTGVVVVPPIPTMNEYALMGFALMLVGSGAVALRRRYSF